MKKYKTSKKYKSWNSTKSKKKNRRAKKYSGDKYFNNSVSYSDNSIKPEVFAPIDFRVFSNTNDCLLFFRNIRLKSFISKLGKYKFVSISLKNVKYIDYSTISILSAIMDELLTLGIVIRTNFPKDEALVKQMYDSGLMNKMRTLKGDPFKKSTKSNLLQFEKGTGILDIKEIKSITETVKQIVGHLTGKEGHCPFIRDILMEMCGNAIEWSEAKNQQWLLGIKYENDKVILTILDLGKGIIKTLNKKFPRKIEDLLKLKPRHEVLLGAFEKKYGSKSNKANRNKGLPLIKKTFESKKIRGLKVLTGAVVLDFEFASNSRTFGNEEINFDGTLYNWEITASSLKK